MPEVVSVRVSCGTIVAVNLRSTVQVVLLLDAVPVRYHLLFAIAALVHLI